MNITNLEISSNQDFTNGVVSICIQSAIALVLFITSYLQKKSINKIQKNIEDNNKDLSEKISHSNMNTARSLHINDPYVVENNTDNSKIIDLGNGYLLKIENNNNTPR